MSKSIALIGNPNCGKTTLFNRLTGAKQKIGNWPGVTVEQHHGMYLDPINKTLVNVMDLPGCYSLIATPDIALDEKITCEYILQARGTLFVNVVDAVHLAHDLYLSLQLLELGAPLVIALNCIDLVQSAGVKIDVAALAKHCGCPVVAISAKSGAGIADLQAAIQQVATIPTYVVDCTPPVQAVLTAWQTHCTPGQALHILEGDVLLASKISDVELASTKVRLKAELQQDLDVYIAHERHQRLRTILADVVQQVASKRNVSDVIDSVVLHKYCGPAIFLGVMYMLFTCAINVGGFLQAWFERASEAVFISGLQEWLLACKLQPWLVNIVAEGLGRGISITVTFTPVLAMMFFCLGVLESSGYMTRAAFIVDRLMWTCFCANDCRFWM